MMMISSSSGCEPEMRLLEKLRLNSADNQENVRTCEDLIESDNIYLVPRRTEEMLQSPLHKDMREVYMRLKYKSNQISSEPRRITGTSTPQGESLNLHPKQFEESENICLEPRRTKELLQSPIHREMRAVHMGIAKEQEKIFSKPRRTKEIMSSTLDKHGPQGDSLYLHTKKPEESDNICLEPRRIQELLQSPIHREMRATYLKMENESEKILSEPRCTKAVMNSPLLRPSEESENICLEPRRIKELLESPIHKDMLPKESSQNARSEKRQLQLEKQAMNLKLERMANYLKQAAKFRGVSQQNLQQMSLQDFINIIGHLLTNTGIPLIVLDKSNFIEQTIYAMELLNYPHKVRKSWLLMPSASIQHIVQMLDFLMDLLPMD